MSNPADSRRKAYNQLAHAGDNLFDGGQAQAARVVWTLNNSLMLGSEYLPRFMAAVAEYMTYTMEKEHASDTSLVERGATPVRSDPQE